MEFFNRVFVGFFLADLFVEFLSGFLWTFLSSFLPSFLSSFALPLLKIPSNACNFS